MFAFLVVALDGVVEAALIWPRVTSLATATTGGGAVTLKVIAASMAVATLLPITALADGRLVPPTIVSLGVLATSTALTLSFNERTTSDGLFVMPLIGGVVVTVLRVPRGPFPLSTLSTRHATLDMGGRP